VVCLRSFTIKIILGNTKNGVNYTYGTKPHAVTQVGANAYTYDANGNMTGGDNRTITWDVENRPVSITKAGVTTTFIYDGDGSRVKQTVGGVVTTYVNKYFEKTGADNTSNYYLGGKLIAVKKITTLSYILQDHLGSTSGTSNGITGALDSSITYFSFGSVRSSTGTIPTDKKFTGQRLDTTGLYYYGARYYDPGIGRFISPDTFMLDISNPQGLNRYSYCFNNPLKHTDPTGNWPPWDQIKSAANSVISIVKDGLQVAESKVTEMKQAAEAKVAEYKQSATVKVEEIKQTIVEAPGIEKIEYKQVGLLQEPARVIVLKEGGFADTQIMDRIGNQNTYGISLYPAGILLHSNYRQSDLLHESFHYNQQSTWSTKWPGWYKDYLSERKALTQIFGNEGLAYTYCSFEQEARIFAGEQSGWLIPPDHLSEILQSNTNLADRIAACLY
jgi:RHS repeat-associated protein